MKEQLNKARTQAIQYWQARNRREQQTLIIGAIVLLIALYIFSLQGIQARIQTLQKRLPELTLNSYEIAAGGRNAPSSPVKHDEDLRSALFRILAEQGVQAELRGLSAERVEMHMAPRPGQSLINSLNTIRLAASARISSVQIRSTEEAGMAEATVILERRR